MRCAALTIAGFIAVWLVFHGLVNRFDSRKGTDSRPVQNAYYELGPVSWAPPVPWREFP